MPGKKPNQRLNKIFKGEKSQVKTGAKKKAIDTSEKEVLTGPVKPGTIFPIVGIGSSAGGLEALEKFLTNMPDEPNIAFVVIQHLSPKHKSIMASLLAKYTSMKITEIEDGTKVEPNCLYINPPNMDVIISGGILYLKESMKTHGINLPIDIFFRSLSEDLRERAICIILSGTATDGTLGIKAVKGNGGIAMVQSPESAKYDGMPRCAISTGLVDFILPVEQIPQQLIRYIRHPYLELAEPPPAVETHFRSHMEEVFALIRSATGHDFSHYKQNTIRRRIERRMAVHQVDKISDYVAYLHRNRVEIGILYKDLLIGVTNFFRDANAFGILKDQAIPGLLRNMNTDSSIRIWVVGCATGEEAYSLAIIFSEVLEEEKKFFNIQVFASDIDSEAIDYARQGIYPASIAADVSPERLNKFFVKENNSYKVKKQIREMVVFALQSIIKDPPFSRIDLVSCRNLMIYMDNTLQKRILPLFHYALNPNGVLFLGPSENVGQFTNIFPPIDRKWKVYGHREGILDRNIIYSDTSFHGPYESAHQEDEKKKPDIFSIHQLAEKIILDNYAPPGVLINERNQVIQFIGETDRYLAMPTGKATFDILRMAREGLGYKLTAALHNANRRQSTVQCKGVRVKYNNEIRNVDLVVRPLVDKNVPKGFMVVLFDDKPAANPPAEEKKKRLKKNDTDPMAVSLEQELQSTREYLQTTIMELESSNEELRSTNEELQSVNEELQIANEEMETSKEELQSTNEELVTVNSELQKKIEELSQANNDINNLFASTEISTIFLDTGLRIQRFTPVTTLVFNLIESDIGRPISDITSNLEYENLPECADRVLTTLEKIEMEVKNKAGSWYNMRISPYRTLENVIEGVVITFLDITRVKLAENVLQRSVNRLSDAQVMANIGNWAWDLTTNTFTWSEVIYSILGLDKATYIPNAESFFQSVHPDDRHLFSPKIFDPSRIKKSYSLEFRVINRLTQEIKHINFSGETLFSADGAPLRTVGIIQDIGTRKRVEEALLASEQKRRLLQEKSQDFIMILDRAANIQFSSCNLGDMTIEQMIGNSVYDYVSQESRSVMKACFERVFGTGAPDRCQADYHTSGGSVQTFAGHVSAIKHPRQVVALVVSCEAIK
jgi:two-component system CheB/CheR fusion protein